MWRLTVVRKYKYSYGETEGSATDNVYFESYDLSDLQCIISWFDKTAVDGKYEFRIVRKEEGEKDA